LDDTGPQQKVDGPAGSTEPTASPPLGAQVPAWYARPVTVLLPSGRPAGDRSKQDAASELMVSLRGRGVAHAVSLKTESVAVQRLPEGAPHAQDVHARVSSKPLKAMYLSG
jgi:hypothetical protein